MPLDTTVAPFDPFAAAGFTKGDDGTYSAPTGPLAAPTPAPAAPSAEPQYRPTIDVGPRPEAPKPGQFGSQLTPAKPMPAVQQPPPPAPPATPVEPPAPVVAAPVQQTPPPAPAAPPAVAQPPAVAAPPAPAKPAAEAPFDPFTQGGFEKKPEGGYQMPGQPPAPNQPVRLPDKPPPNPTAVTAGTSAAGQPWYEGLWNTMKGVHEAVDAMGEDAAHAMTLGFDDVVSPIPAALLRSAVRGIPFTDAYKQIQQEHQTQRHELEAQHPIAAGAGSLIGAGASLAGTGALFTSAKGFVPFVRNVAASSGLGAVSGFGETEGDISQRLVGARKGGEWGAALGVAFPAAFKAVQGIWRSLSPAKQVGRKAGETFNEMTGGRAPTFRQAPVQDFPLGVGGATGDAALAAAERRAATIDDAAAVARRTGQQDALVREATTQRPSGAQLASGAMTPAAASARLADRMRNAMRIFKQHENFLWNRPSIAAKAMDIPAVKGEIYNAGKSMPSRFHRAIGGHAGLRSVLEDLAAMPNTAKLADLNDIRSDLLGIARTDAEPIIRKIAGDLAAAMLKAIERNPALRADPAAWADYVAARDFTHTKWNTIGQKPFQNIIKAGADDRRAGGSLFGFGNPISGERIPQGMSQVIDALEDIRDQWRVLATRGLDPTVADAAARELGQGAVDYIINSMIQPVAASTSGATAGQLNDLQQWIARNRGWLVSSRLLEPAQLDLLDNIATASKMGAAPANLRGGTGSETFERLMSNNNPRIIDIFSTALNKRIFAAGGAMIGSYLGHLGEAGIGFLLGSGVERIGLQMLHHMYEMPTEQLRAKLIEAANNPQIAADLMQTARQAKGFSDATIAWLRGLGGEAGGGLGAWFENDRVRAGAGTPTPSVGR